MLGIIIDQANIKTKNIHTDNFIGSLLKKIKQQFSKKNNKFEYLGWVWFVLVWFGLVCVWFGLVWVWLVWVWFGLV